MGRSMMGAALVKAFLAEHRTDRRRLFNRSTDPKRVALRAKLIRALHEDGLNYSEIARVLEIDISTARYWIIEEERRSKMRSGRARNARRCRRKIYHQWEECAQAMEAA